MKKYLLLTILPILASCTSTPSSTMLSDIPERPSKDGADYTETNLNKGLSYPHMVVDRSANSSLDVTEDSAGLISGVGTRQVRNSGNTVVRTTRRGSHIVRKEGTRYAEVVYDAGDQVADVAHDETIAYGGFIDNGVQRTLHTGGTLICGTFKTYSNSIDSATRGIFGGLLRCTVRDTKNYMVGSLNDQYPAAGLPGAGWRGPRPQLPAYQAEETSGKGIYTASK
jgi:hypothetical protein